MTGLTAKVCNVCPTMDTIREYCGPGGQQSNCTVEFSLETLQKGI